MQKNESGSLPLWGVFILSPFISLILALKNFRHPFTKNILWAFTIFYGLTFIISDEGLDSARYRNKFIELSNTSLTFEQFTETLYDTDSKQADILDPTIQYVLSRFTDNPRYLFGMYGLIFGFFFSRNLWYILDKLKPKLSPTIFLLVLSFALLSPIWDLNGFRFNTSLHIYLYGLLPFLFENNKKRLVFSFLTILSHFAFLFPVIILLIYMVAGNRLYIYFFIFLATMFISELKVDAINNAIESSLPEVFKIRSMGYIGEEVVEDFKGYEEGENLNWYVTAHRNVLRLFIMISLIIIFLEGRKYFQENKGMLRLMCFSMLFYGCANISSLVPSGRRFLIEANLIALAFIIFYSQKGPEDSLLNKLLPFSIPILLLFITVKIRMGFETMGVFTVFGNPLLIMFFEKDVALITLLK